MDYLKLSSKVNKLKILFQKQCRDPISDMCFIKVISSILTASCGLQNLDTMNDDVIIHDVIMAVQDIKQDSISKILSILTKAIEQKNGNTELEYLHHQLTSQQKREICIQTVYEYQNWNPIFSWDESLKNEHLSAMKKSFEDKVYLFWRTVKA
jgi:uncharacterized protein YunC (DUF1805 family)